MTASNSSLRERLSQPEYTGENRCLPCTLVNVCIALVLGGAVSRLTRRSVGAIVFVGSLALIYLRGYLVPGTPALTKRYLPDWLLALFDKEPKPVQNSAITSGRSQHATTGNGQTHETVSTNGESHGPARGDVPVDPEAVLASADVVEPCADEDDLCLTDSFASAWQDACVEFRDEAVRQDHLEALFDTETITVSPDELGEQVSVLRGDNHLATWPSEGSMVADLAADRVLQSRSDEWESIEPEQRFGILAGLRSFLDVCPLCDGPVRLGQDTVKSCCRSWDVISVRCTECDSRLLELDPETLETVA